jgi:hypothetical protein
MKRILEFLSREGAFLYESLDFSLCASEYSPLFGGTGSVILKNDFIEIKLWLDRDKLFADLRALGEKGKYSWISLGIIRELLESRIPDSTTLDVDNSNFLRSQFPRILKLFDRESVLATKSRCIELEKQRSKRIFG